VQAVSTFVLLTDALWVFSWRGAMTVTFPGTGPEFKASTDWAILAVKVPTLPLWMMQVICIFPLEMLNGALLCDHSF
jgi:hypothetical protein